jgi:hypothetical protein
VDAGSRFLGLKSPVVRPVGIGRSFFVSEGYPQSMNTVTGSESKDLARRTARRQLRQVLLLLAILDSSVLALVVGLAVAWSRLQFPTPYFLVLVLGAVGGVLAVRIALGVRLKRRSGDFWGS